MAKSNRERVGEIMDALKAGLAGYVLREYKATYKQNFGQEIAAVITSERYELPRGALANERALAEALDTQALLKLMWNRWNDVFGRALGQAERSYVSELMGARNNWAHQGSFTLEDAQRIADTAERLLRAVGSPEQAEVAGRINRELLRLRFESEMRQAQRAAVSEMPSTTSPGLLPWRKVVMPHPDVASGNYLQAEFAADLAQVVSGKADPEYGDPREFFRRTYLTEGLKDLLVAGVRRLTGQGGDPVVQLQTSFGGGKTHSMLALYHLVGGRIRFSEIPDGQTITSRIGEVDDRLEARRAVIVGSAFSPTQPRQYSDCTTHTLWGDIAYQIGGVAAYRNFETADLAGVSPGSDALLALLEAHGPVLIIIDELIAFARNLYGVSERLPVGSFDAVMTFVQSLTEAVKRSSDSMLLIAIPQSDIEIGGEGGRVALEILANTIGRLESVWKPVSPTESFAIVRRRLFASEINYAARDAVLSAFHEMYKAKKGDFPREVAESDYYQRMKDAYPIHPELFARLYEDWSTLERFQRTRGVLRLMAAVIHRLWQDNDQSLLIMPGSIPLWAAAVRNEMLRYLPHNWSAIVDTDIDGEHSKPYQIDQSVATLGQLAASRRVARAIFVGSAPAATRPGVRGVEEVRIYLATVQPGESAASFSDALRRMSSQLTYLYSDGSRYWYDTHPTVNRIAEDRAQAIPLDQVHQEAVRRLKAERYRREDFPAVHIAPQSSGDIPDDNAHVRLVVFGLERVYQRSVESSPAQKFAEDILKNRGSAQRLYRNMLIFIAPDTVNAEAWQQALREYLAWKSINDEAEQLNLDAQQRKQVAAALKRADETVDARLQETYVWLIVPKQDDPLEAIKFDAHRLAMNGQDTFYERAARKLHESEWVIRRWAPDNLREELDRYLWRDQPHVSLKKLWEYFACYCYLPRLQRQEVLLRSVEDGIARPDAPFAYATMVGADGTYKGLALGRSAQVYFDDNSVLVRVEVAQAQIEAQSPTLSSAPSPLPAAPRPLQVSREASVPAAPPPPKVMTHYYGRVLLDPQRLNHEMTLIAEEVLKHLIQLSGSQVEIALEIRAERESGFDEATVRTVSENSRTLKFKPYGFESG